MNLSRIITPLPSHYATGRAPALLLSLLLLNAAQAQTAQQTAHQTPHQTAAPAQAAPLASLLIQASAENRSLSFDGVVEAVRQTVVAAQVAGAVQQLDVKAGDAVKAGQILLRIDARAADQAASASEAQAQAARAALHLAERELARQQQLFKQQYISQAALDQADSQFKATQAQVNATLAQLGVSRTQTSFHVVRSPYDGVVAEVPVALGDMAMPGRPLLTVYAPDALRVTINLPQSVAARLSPSSPLTLEIPGAPSERIKPTTVQLLPVVDANTHTVQMRLGLPAKLAGLSPGMFARVWLSGQSTESTERSPSSPNAQTSRSSATLLVPRSALVKRAELNAIYVLDANGRPLLRQVRLGAVQGEQVEVLSGLSSGERIATDPAAAARIR